MPKMLTKTPSIAGQVLGVIVTATIWVCLVVALGAFSRLICETGKLGWTGFGYF